MDERGLWELFFKTGLPEAYLAIAGEHQEYFLWKEPSKTAFQPDVGAGVPTGPAQA